jgi:hypothetical protein
MLRFLLQALIAAVAALIIPVTCALRVTPGPPMPDGSPDNGPILGAGAFLFLVPVWLLLLSVYFGAGAAFLRRLRSLTLAKLQLLNLLPALALGLAYGYERSAYGIWHAAESFALVAGWSLVALALGTLAWWLLHRRLVPGAATPGTLRRPTSR